MAEVHKVKAGKKLRKLLKDVWRASALLVPAKVTPLPTAARRVDQQLPLF